MTDIINIKDHKKIKKEKVEKAKKEKTNKLTKITEINDILSCRDALARSLETLNQAATSMTIKGDKIILMGTIINLAEKRKVANAAYIPFDSEEISDSLREKLGKLAKEFDDKLIQLIEKEKKL